MTLIFAGTFASPGLQAQVPPFSPSAEATAAEPAPAEQTDEQAAPGKVEIDPLATDAEIAERLQRILAASEWFDQPSVRVEEGIAFLSGATDTEVRKKWAGDLARNTRDVVAVVNQIQLKTPSIWDWRPAVRSLHDLWQGFIRKVPVILFGMLVITIAWFAGRGVTSLLRRSFSDKDSLNRLLREVMARAAGVGVFLLGLYLVLLVGGLARLAVTVLGGTGLIGLVIGIAFRDITENFLASIFLSIQRPFRAGDLIEVDEITGYVQKLTVRTTVLMSLDGNVVQIPNSTVYKNSLRNYTSNPNRREAFIIGIGYDDAVPNAQEVAMEVLRNHPAVLDDPEPWVLVDNLGSSTVNLKIYFWLDGTRHSWLKVRSSVIRLVKRSYQEYGISMPDEAREVIISREVPLSLRLSGLSADGQDQIAQAISAKTESAKETPSADSKTAPDIEPKPSNLAPGETDAISTSAEGSLTSEAKTVEEQAKNVSAPDDGVDLLK